jgi:hypothetical protein
MERYEVWVTLEKWDGDDKIEDVQTTKIFENASEENAELIWSLCESVSIAAKDSIDGMFYS